MSTSIINNIFKSCSVRSVFVKGQLLFVAKDAAEAMGHTKPDQAIRAHCKNPLDLPLELRGKIHGSSKLITEGDLFRMALRSRTELAERFADWVADVVLPNLREHGGYVVGQEALTPEEQEVLNVQHRASALAVACRDGVIKSRHINKADSEKIFKILLTVAHSCISLDSLGTFERDAAGALSRAGLGQYVKAIPLDIAKAQDAEWIHAKKHSLQVKKHNSEGNGWG